MNLFNKWTTFKREFHAVGANRRPLLASDCLSLVDAEKYRKEIIRDVTKKIASIQNATLGEYRIREINDEINKLMRTKHYWELRIRELGGGEMKKGRQFYDVEGKELPGVPGYRYYGAAKDLPGVRELFAEEADEIEQKKQRRFVVSFSPIKTQPVHPFCAERGEICTNTSLPTIMDIEMMMMVF